MTQAQTVLQPTANIDPAAKQAMLQVARLNTLSHDWKQALKQYEVLSGYYPSDPFILEPLARIQHKLGLIKDWAATISQAIRCYKALGMQRKAELLERQSFQISKSIASS